MTAAPRRLGSASLAVLLVAAAPAAAQTATAPGYVLNPTGGDTTRQRDEYGMSHLWQTRRRTPTGFLYPEPLEPQTLSPLGEGCAFASKASTSGCSRSATRCTRWRTVARTPAIR